MAQVSFNDKDPNNKTLTTGDVNALKHAINDNESIINNGTVSGVFDQYNQFRYNYHLIPKTNSSFDLGSAEYKVRHLFLSTNSVWLGDEAKIGGISGKMHVMQRNTEALPYYITGASTLNKTEAEVLTALNKGAVSDITLQELEQYAQTIDPNATMSDIFPPETSDNYRENDYVEIVPQSKGYSKTKALTRQLDLADFPFFHIPCDQGNFFTFDCQQSNNATYTIYLDNLRQEVGSVYQAKILFKDISTLELFAFYANDTGDTQAATSLTDEASFSVFDAGKQAGDNIMLNITVIRESSTTRLYVNM